MSITLLISHSLTSTRYLGRAGYDESAEGNGNTVKRCGKTYSDKTLNCTRPPCFYAHRSKLSFDPVFRSPNPFKNALW